VVAALPPNDDGYRLWLRYDPLPEARRTEWLAAWSHVALEATSPTLDAARRELVRGLGGLLGRAPHVERGVRGPAALVVATSRSPRVTELGLESALKAVGPEGFILRATTVGHQPCTLLASNEDIGVLYGVFHLLRHLQTGRTPDTLPIADAPKLRHRMLQQWDNLDRTVERGYAGFTIWDWHTLPDYVSPQCEDYARANASIGISRVLLTNVNANALALTEPYLRKFAALADVFRPYGIRVHVSARFSAPIEIGSLSTADPLDADVVRFWRDKADEIYRIIPDFGGFVVKANSEGQPGPGDYGRTHAEGANLLADALAPHGGTVFWRAFIYANDGREDRAKQAYLELQPLDGSFRDNVVLQAKNGPIDFQPREPFHPLFGAMPRTALVAEFQLTQEYLGFATHLAYLGTLMREVLASDTFAAGEGSTVARILEGAVHRGQSSGMVAVANIGTDRNWCGHPFAQANWFAFGRLAWNPDRDAADIADEWLRMTFSNDDRFVTAAQGMMLGSREAVVDYMTPLGLHHLMAWDHHYGPGPWVAEGRADWTSVYFHRADAAGVGFDRSPTGSNAVAQYAAPLRDRLARIDTCPEALLLWFHHVAWDHVMRSGRTLWEELCHRYSAGVDSVRAMQRTWESLEGFVDAARHGHVRALLRIQEKEARWWRDACLLYFQTFAQQPIPTAYEPPSGSLDYFMRIKHHYVPGI
jgi:alpha-glucuronidase